jgi:hypothetical protein
VAQNSTVRADTITKLDGTVQAVVTTTVDVEGSEKPAAVAEAIVRYIP